ncbi:hypothetical protein [Vibrio owensii]|uniref:hypothetical protein n=1 Tax=Vibrio harveyi group TaxID=717610 RepID=UPI003CC60512
MKFAPLRLRTSKFVGFFPYALEQGVAEVIRAPGQPMHKGHFCRNEVDIKYPEVLLQGVCMKRTSKNPKPGDIHEVIEVVSDRSRETHYATYLPIDQFEKARQLVLTDARLEGGTIRFVKVMIPDIEALTHGKVTQISPERNLRSVLAYAVENFTIHCEENGIDTTSQKDLVHHLVPVSVEVVDRTTAEEKLAA